MYKAIAYFTDLQDNGHIYRAGDVFPRSGFEATEERINELSSNENRRGKPLIAEAKGKKKNAK